MTVSEPENKDEDGVHEDDSDSLDAPSESRPREIGGRDGLDPTRYGDWEKGGRCIDF